MSKDNTNEEKIIELTVAEATAIVEDRKATEAVAKSKAEHTALNDKLKAFNAPYLIGYKRQAEIYGWILSKLGLEIHQRSYFFYVNAGYS